MQIETFLVVGHECTLLKEYDCGHNTVVVFPVNSSKAEPCELKLFLALVA